MARLILKAHARLVELTAGTEQHRDPRRIPDGYGKTPYTLAFDVGRYARLPPKRARQRLWGVAAGGTLALKRDGLG
jgi:hypothetical protein